MITATQQRGQVMFGLDLSGLGDGVRGLFNAQWRLWAGAGFVALAIVAIQYEESIAPGVSRISDAWGGVASELGRKVASLAL
jgi:hypothetical protein